jgi:hypothetical protein
MLFSSSLSDANAVGVAVISVHASILQRFPSSVKFPAGDFADFGQKMQGKYLPCQIPLNVL